MGIGGQGKVAFNSLLRKCPAKIMFAPRLLALRSLSVFAIVAVCVSVFAVNEVAVAQVDFVAAKPADAKESLGQADQKKTEKKKAGQQKVKQKKVDAVNDKANDKGPAHTEPPKQDPDFSLMGEFLGKVTEKGKPISVGLQVRVLGKDRLEAIAYRGGLPGQPKFDPQPVKMIGQRSGDFVILSGGPWAVFVEKNSCRLVNRSGKTIGQLKRVRRTSPTLHAPVPSGATVLFDGANTDHFSNGKMTVDGLLKEGADLKPMFQDYNLHVEFRLPYMPLADSQKRGNSGLYLQSRYECQILDSFATEPVYNGLGALYRFKVPDINMALPPLAWQTYDVHFTAPRWASDGSKVRNATISSWVNGVKVQDNVSLPNKTGAGKAEEPILLPIRIQDHGDPVRFRNVWILDRGLASMPEFPVFTTKEQRQAANKTYQQQRQKRLKAERAAKVKVAKANARLAKEKLAKEKLATEAADKKAK